MRIATWNINSVRLRIAAVTRFLRTHQPDVLCLQETKARDDVFPAKALKRAGYEHLALFGQKGYHGVAIASKLPFDRVWSEAFCDTGDARHIAVSLGGIEIHDFYVPAGGDIPDPALNPKFAHKLRFLEAMAAQFGRRRDAGTARAVLVGDLNVAPHENDVWSHRQLLNVVSHTEPEVTRFAAAQAAFGWRCATRHFVPYDQKLYTWWSYRNQDWRKSDRGRRLDHVWVSEALAPALTGHTVLKDMRDWTKPSDHVPVVVDLAL